MYEVLSPIYRFNIILDFFNLLWMVKVWSVKTRAIFFFFFLIEEKIVQLFSLTLLVWNNLI